PRWRARRAASGTWFPCRYGTAPDRHSPDREGRRSDASAAGGTRTIRASWLPRTTRAIRTARGRRNTANPARPHNRAAPGWSRRAQANTTAREPCPTAEAQRAAPGNRLADCDRELPALSRDRLRRTARAWIGAAFR